MRVAALELAILEPVEVGGLAGPTEVLTGKPDEVAGEGARHGMLVGEDRRVELPRDGKPFLAVLASVEAETGHVDFQAQIDPAQAGYVELLFDQIADRAAFARHQADGQRGVVGAGHKEAVEVVGAVKGHQAGHLLEAIGRELEGGGSDNMECALPASNKRLVELRDDAFAALRAQPTWAFGETELLGAK